MPSIGIFDSGIGGLTVFSQVEKMLPNEHLIYLGDTARVPYGTKSKTTIERFALEDVQLLLAHDVKMVIAACNTVSALALPLLRKNFHIPILGVIEPAVQKALASTKTHRIGVIGTRATIESRAYEKIFHTLHPETSVWSSACPLFVPLVEEDWIDRPETFSIAEQYLAPLREHQVDTLILGCTHYPLLGPLIQKIMGPAITLIDSAASTALACATLLQTSEPKTQRKPPEHLFYVTDEPERFRYMGEKFLGRVIPHVQKANLETLEKVIA